jgi:hypothetical protein
MLFSNVAVSGDAIEIVSLKFKEGVGFEEQSALMMKLSSVMTGFHGFKSRDFYYGSENGRWVDFVVWSDLELAKKAVEASFSDPVVGAVMSKVEEKSVIFSFYEHIGGKKV